MQLVCRVFLVLMLATVGLANICNLNRMDVVVSDRLRDSCNKIGIGYVNDPQTGLKVVGDVDTCGVAVQCVNNVLRFSGFGTYKEVASNCGHAMVKFVFDEFMIDCDTFVFE
ncbi:uncharacterized protein LOC124138443 [Haliotis rufescens]|uniref:uncharacterized protein LOC124138443 n=1 Tax=Haliotis rufescens TaxID=6454 RepID=UPI001EAFF6BC|nr:uncharacterized protein LOC124138443 [Haliotis rufescens]